MSLAFDVLIIGSGAAGLTAALNLAPTKRVAVIAKGGSTRARPAGLRAASRRCWRQATRSRPCRGHDDRRRGPQRPRHRRDVVAEAPRAIERLAELGVPFNAGDGPDRWHLTREGGHSHRRIVHVADATGWAVQQALRGGGDRAPEHHARPRHGRDRPRHRPPCEESAPRARSTACTPSIGRPARSRRSPRARRCWRRAARDAPISIRPHRAGRPATASPWRGAQDAACRTWNSCSSTRPASTIWRSRTS